ncbi:DUF4372 domain-containing protein [Tannerella forsythia]|uniref:DUF4372 domain-containing protein n=1 Tax=Tannerella forsythia TaxID=28112 RepID=A0A3P1YGG6_TANFO|nr:DUF4372 domain-containing protein [Tannerella forsythia]
MNKNTYFFGQSVFGQLISLIDNRMITRNSAKHNADRYMRTVSLFYVSLRTACMLLLCPSMKDIRHFSCIECDFRLGFIEERYKI